jgi:hypothetical protein
MVGEGRRSGVVALVAALVPALVAATLVPAPAQATDPVDHLSAWTMEADFTYTEVTTSPGGNNNFSFDASYADYSTDSFVATWSGSSSMTSTFSCDGGGQGGYHIEGDGSGAGEYWRGTGFPSDYGLTGDLVGLEAGGGPSYVVDGTVTTCGGDSSSTSQEQSPINNFVWLPGTDTQLEAVPEGTVLTDTYSRVVHDNVNGNDSTLTWTVTYMARKGPWTDDPECSDGLDNDGDGRVDVGPDPGCTDGEDTSEHGPLACDNGEDDDGDGRSDYLVGDQGDPDCAGPEDDDESGVCVPDEEPTTATYKTVTDIPGPDIHWYTTTVTARGCTAENGQRFISDLDVDRHAEGGPVPSALGLLGLETGTESPVEYDPDPVGNTTSASGDFAYSMCFDLTKLLDKAGATKYLKQKVKNRAEKLIGRLMKRLGYKRIKRKDRKEVVEAFKDAVDDRFSAETVATMLEDKFKIPGKIARFGGRLVESQTEDARKLVKTAAGGMADSNVLVDASAEEAASRLVGDTFGRLDRLTTFCGGGTGGESNLVTWNALATATASATGAELDRTDLYLHPILTVKDD